MLTQSRLKELLAYDPETGIFTRRVSTCNRVKIGGIAGSLNVSLGYIAMHVGGHRNYAHRLAWLYMTGEWPKAEIDHINGIRDDNRFCNLREATRAENVQNKRLYTRNTSGFMGVYWHNRNNKWRARIQVKGRMVSLGYHTTAEAAHAAYLAAKAKYHAFQPTIRF